VAYALLCLRCDVVICILLAYFMLQRTLNLEEKKNIRHWQSWSRMGMSNKTWTLQARKLETWGVTRDTKSCTLKELGCPEYSDVEISFRRESKAVS
jgi:hypothetical protein